MNTRSHLEQLPLGGLDRSATLDGRRGITKGMRPAMVDPTNNNASKAPPSPEETVRDRLFTLNDYLLSRASSEGSLSLRDVLLKLVELARDLTGARYGALGVFSGDGLLLKEFIYSGMSEETARGIGRLPTGRGLLGAVVREGGPVRVDRIDTDPRSEGLPPGHPPMTSFLGLPLRIGAEVFGNIYLADKGGGEPFSAEDQLLLSRFAAQAGLTVAYTRQLQAEEQRLLEAVVEHAPSGLAYFPTDPTLEPLWNSAASRLLGRVSRADDPAASFTLRHLDGRALEAAELPVGRALREGAVVNLELRVERRDPPSPPTPVLISAAPVQAPSGAVIGVVVVLQDISARIELERLREDFAAMVAHDLRTPLQAVLAQIETLLLRAASGAATIPTSTLLRMKANGRRIELLVRDLLDASRIDARQVVLHRQPLDVAATVGSLVPQIQAALGTRPIQVDTAPHLPAVEADQLRLEQILTNLIENASKYSREGETIHVAVSPRLDGVELSVADRGPGIEPAELPHLFDRYYQSKKARKAGLGLGLGLFIARGLVEAHGGRIDVESTVGVGSVFRVWLPGVAPASPRAP